MRSNHRNTLTHVLTSSSALALGFSLAAFAGGAAIAQDDEQSDDRVVVTGSRIVRQDFTANSPIVTVEQEMFQGTTSLTVESVLNQLPQFTQDARSEFRTTSVEPTTDQSPGTAQVNLRGLGSNRSLVLIDGRRATPVNGAMAIDVNAIPSTAVQRVEIISGGASAVYGADAVGGVVNFILKDDYEGISLSTRYGITQRGDQKSLQVSGLFGANFANDRGNVMFGGDLSTRGNALLADRDWALEEIEDPYIFSLPVFGSFSPQKTTYSATSVAAGVTNNNRPSQAAIDSIFPALPPGSVLNSNAFLLNDDGTIFTSSIAGGPVGANSALGAYKYNGATYSEEFPECQQYAERFDGTIMEVACFAEFASPLDRYSFFGRGRFELTDSIAVTMRGNYATTYTRSVLFQAAGNFIVPVGNELWTGSEYSPSSVLTSGATHPDYLPGGRYGLNCPATGGCTESQVFPLSAELNTLLASRPRPNEDIVLTRQTDWGPLRGSSTRNDIFQLELGFEGELGDRLGLRDLFWDVSMSHGETHSYYSFQGFGSLNRFRAVVGSPNFGRGFEATGNPDFGGTQAGSATCTTGLPIIRDFEVSQDCITAYESVMQNYAYLEQNVAEANLTGTLFDLPAGPLQFALGTAYRENSLDFQTDPLNDLNNFDDQPLGLFPKTNAEGYISVAELYGEVLVPLIEDVPFIQEFSLELGGRLSDYDPSGTVETYKILGDWVVNDWARIRGGYNRASRAPNLNELFAGRAQSVASGGFSTDPCAQNNNVAAVVYSANPANNTEGAAGAAHVLQVCRNIMTRDSSRAGEAPNTGAGAYYGRLPADQDFGSAGATVTKGNPNVGPETADTYTVGLVLNSPSESPWLRGLSATVDYYRIEIADLIAVSSVNALIQDCFSLANNPSADATTFACESFLRNPLNGEGTFVDRIYTNQGWARLSGIDIQLNWRSTFDDIGLDSIPGALGVNFVMTIPLEQLTQGSPTANRIEGVGTQYADLGVGGGAFDYTTLTTFNYFIGDLNLSLRWEYSPPIEASVYATNPATNIIGVPDGASLFALSGSYRVNDVMTLRAGVDNLLDAKPPRSGHASEVRAPYSQLSLPRSIGGFGGSGAGAGAYDVLGRRFFVGVDATF